MSKRFFDLHVSCKPGWLTASQHVFKSGLDKKILGVDIVKNGCSQSGHRTLKLTLVPQ